MFVFVKVQTVLRTEHVSTSAFSLSLSVPEILANSSVPLAARNTRLTPVCH